MNSSFSLLSSILQMDWVAICSDLQAHPKEIHKNRSHPKKLKLNIRSENKKYSEWSEKGSLGSTESFDVNEGNKEETSPKSFFPCEKIRFKRSFNIHCFLLFIVSSSSANRKHLKYYQQSSSSFSGGEV